MVDPRSLWCAALLIAATGTGCTSTEVRAAQPKIVSDGHTITVAPDAPQWRYLELAVAKEGPPLKPLPVPGHVDLDEKRTASIGTPLPGRVEVVQVRLGDPVKKGDRLFSVRSGAFADLDRELESARADMTVKERMLQRVRDLYTLKAAPEKEVLASEAELKTAELALKAAQAKRSSLAVDSAGDNLFWVHAPRAGSVVELDVFANQEVTPDREKPLLRISDLDEVLVLADVPEIDIIDVRRGGAVHIRNQVAGIERDGTVDHVSEVVDPQRRTVEVRVRLDNPDHALRANTFVEVTALPDTAVKRLKVPDTGIVNDGKRSLMFVARGKGRLEPIEVVPGRRIDGEVEIHGGLEPGSTYVARGALLLFNQLEGGE